MNGAPFHLLVKPSGSACNLACDYCFFLRKSELYPGQSQRMSDISLGAYLEQLFEAHPDGEVSVAFQGGEPTTRPETTSPQQSTKSLPRSTT